MLIDLDLQELGAKLWNMFHTFWLKNLLIPMISAERSKRMHSSRYCYFFLLVTLNRLVSLEDYLDTVFREQDEDQVANEPSDTETLITPTPNGRLTKEHITACFPPKTPEKDINDYISSKSICRSARDSMDTVVKARWLKVNNTKRRYKADLRKAGTLLQEKERKGQGPRNRSLWRL